MLVEFSKNKPFSVILQVIACALVALLVILVEKIDGAQVDTNIKTYCRDKERLATSVENDEYLLVDVEFGSTVILECKFCDDKRNNHEGKIWHWQDSDQLNKSREIDLEMNNNASLNRIHINVDFALVIRDFLVQDAAIYRCIGQKGYEDDKKWNYRLEPVFKSYIIDDPDEGNIKEWEKYREINLIPVTKRILGSSMKDFVEIRQAGIKLEIISEWGPWSKCKKCMDKQGIKAKRAFCRIKRNYYNKVKENSYAMAFFKTKPFIPCRSVTLYNRFPILSNATRILPEFLLIEKCTSCKKEKKMKKGKFKYKKRYILVEGAHLNILCPEASIETNVVWRRDSLPLEKGKGHSFRKNDPMPRVLVDVYYSIYLKDVSEDEQGTYTCYVDNVHMMQAKVIVVLKSKFLDEAFLRHLMYLSFVLLIVLIFYCGSIIKACQNRKKYKTYEQLKQTEISLKKS